MLYWIITNINLIIIIKKIEVHLDSIIDYNQTNTFYLLF